MSEVFLTLFNRSLTACWLIAVVLVLRLVFRKAPRWPRLLLWAVVGFRLLPFSIPHPWSLVPTREVLPEEMLYSSTPHIESGIPAVDAAVNPAFTGSLAPSPGASVNPLQVLTWLAGWVWLIGLAGMLLYSLLLSRFVVGVLASVLTGICRAAAAVTWPARRFWGWLWGRHIKLWKNRLKKRGKHLRIKIYNLFWPDIGDAHEDEEKEKKI